jgi:hypothetical protein
MKKVRVGMGKNTGWKGRHTGENETMWLDSYPEQNANKLRISLALQSLGNPVMSKERESS